MKIDSTDASSLTLFRTQSTQPVAEAPAPDIKDSKDKPIDMVSISQLSDFEKRDLPISDKVVIDAIDRVNKAIAGENRKFVFSIHEKTKEIMVKVVDSETNQVIREIPPEKILDMVAKMMEMAGIIVDERR